MIRVRSACSDAPEAPRNILGGLDICYLSWNSEYGIWLTYYGLPVYGLPITVYRFLTMLSVAQPSFRQGLLGALIATIAIVILAFGYQSWKSAQQRSIKDFERFNTIPDFSFVDQTGQTVTKEALKGKVWVADFFFTRCPGPCPIMSSRFAELDRNFSRGGSLALVSFTVDPQFDTSSVLSRYAQRYEASKRWHFLTGEKQKIYDLAVNGFQLAVQDPGSVMPNFIHSTKFALVDIDGVIRGYYDGTSEEVVQKLLLDVGSLLRRGGR